MVRDFHGAPFFFAGARFSLFLVGVALPLFSPRGAWRGLLFGSGQGGECLICILCASHSPPRCRGIAAPFGGASPGTSQNIYPGCFHGESPSGFSTMRHIPQRMLRRQALQRTREWCPQQMTKVGDRAGPGTGGRDGTPTGRALSHGLLRKLNTWPSTVPPATPSLMKEQDEACGRRESQARARKANKRSDFRESPAEARKTY